MERASSGSVLRHREYAALWVAYALSLGGDQVARVALAVLVFDRTGSPIAAAAAPAVTFLPWVVGGPMLAGLGDRYPRRRVMIACDVLSAVLIAAMALPGLGWPVMLVLLFVAVLLVAPFAAARSALVRDLFPDDKRYAAATAINSVTNQSAQVIGYTCGGLVVALVGARTALLLDAGTFVVSALVIRALVQDRAAPRTGPRKGHWAEVRAGSRLVFGNRRLRTLAFYAWLATFHMVPMGVVVPYVVSHGHGATAVGLLLATATIGAAAGMAALTRWVPTARQPRLMPWLAPWGSATLIPCLADPPLVVVGLLWMVGGAAMCYQLTANVAFVREIPNERRSQAFGLVVTGLAVGQGLGVLAAGALAETFRPEHVVGMAGVVGTVVTLVLARTAAARELAAPPPRSVDLAPEQPEGAEH